jgi:hypothetical protein
MNPSTCETDCELLDEATSGYLAVSIALDPYQTCIAKLDTVRGDIPMQVSSSNVQKRNGSSTRPINLPDLKRDLLNHQEGNSFRWQKKFYLTFSGIRLQLMPTLLS